MKKKAPSLNSKRKCNYEKRQITLDACHQQRVETFKTQYEKLQKTTPKESSSDTEVPIEHTIEDEIDYYTKTADILYNYYDTLENHTQSSSNQIASTHRVSTGSGNKSILDFFASSSISQRSRSKSAPEIGGTDEDAEDETDASIHQTITYTDPDSSNKSMLYDKYLYETDENYVKTDDNDDRQICEFCQSEDQTMLIQEGMVYCNDCSTVRFIIIDNDKPSYKEPQKEISYLNYKRKNHFNEWLNQIQGKETTEIPEDIFNSILLEIKKLKIQNMADITHAKIREILKKLKLNKYYEHTPYISYRITGIPNQYLSPELEDKLRNMFELIQVPFLKHSPASRKNFLSYSYCIHKMLQLLGEDKYLSYFPLLKNREKLHQQEQIWSKICEELNWQIIRSI